MSEINDLEVIDRVLGGDTDSFSDIIVKYRNRIFRFAYSRVNNYDEALDLTQDILVIIFESLKTFRRESSFSTWMYSIMVNYCKNYRKRAERYSSVSIHYNAGEGEFELPIPDERENPEKDIITADSLRIVKEELYGLNDEYRDILILRDIEGVSYNDISKILGIGMSSVKVRIHRGREMLKKRLQDRGLI
jgi:RNA polymerase sigma-70 factor (ECF subfamily)